MSDPGISHITIKMNTDLWMAIEKSESGEEAFRQRALKEFEYQGWRKDEIELIGRDSVFSESCSECYRSTIARFHGWRRSLPSSVKIDYQLPGTRKKSGAPKKEVSPPKEEAGEKEA